MTDHLTQLTAEQRELFATMQAGAAERGLRIELSADGLWVVTYSGERVLHRESVEVALPTTSRRAS